MPYGEALEFQRAVARARISGEIDEDVLLLVEHPPVVTLGRTAKEANLLASPELLAARGVEVFEVERGGDVTFHGPGQLVGYPIIDLKRHKQDLHWYLRQVEEALIAALARARAFRPSGTRARPASGRSGRKIASIGVHARDWVTWHGFALNVTTDLSYFDLIVPCGIQDVTMTSVARELGVPRADEARVRGRGHSRVRRRLRARAARRDAREARARRARDIEKFAREAARAAPLVDSATRYALPRARTSAIDYSLSRTFRPLRGLFDDLPPCDPHSGGSARAAHRFGLQASSDTATGSTGGSGNRRARPVGAANQHPPDAGDHRTRRARRDGAPALRMSPHPRARRTSSSSSSTTWASGSRAPSAVTIPMPMLDSLASQGLRYNQFHTTALCSPTRMAILTGRNHHTVNTGAIMELATAFTGNTGIRPLETTPIAEILRQNGYSTAAYGKYHETPPWEISVSGSFDRWPTRSGFDKFYGFIGGETNQWSRRCSSDGTVARGAVARSEVPRHRRISPTTPIEWMQRAARLTPGQALLRLLRAGRHARAAPGPEGMDREVQGTVRRRAGTSTARRRSRGRSRWAIVPAGTKLAPKPKAIKDWDALTPVEKKVFARQMEVYAGFAAQTDYEIGRLLHALQDMGVADNTLVFYEAGDNGASAEGGMVGMLNEMTVLQRRRRDGGGYREASRRTRRPEDLQPLSPRAGPVAGDTPFEWTKQVAGSYGGTRNGLVISWPARIKAKGEIRSQWSHVTDIAPTVLEAAAHSRSPRW